MKLEEQIAHYEYLTKQMKDILLKKGADYANKDVLSNFKLAGRIAGLTPEQNCLSLISTKVARLGNLLSKDNSPLNEPLKDTVVDLANYSILLHMLLFEDNY